MRSKLKKITLVITSFINAGLWSLPVSAQIDVNSVAPSGVNTDAGFVDSTVKNVINILLFVVGVGAVIMLIVGAIRYVVSAGDQQAVAGAKNTILYAIVGIVVAVMAFAIVNFVLGPQGLNVTPGA